MRAYILYKDKSVKEFKRLMTSGGQVFDKYRALATSFLRYAGGDLDKNLADYDAVFDLNSINLESVFPASYKWLVSNVSLKNLREYLESVEKRITEFDGKEDNLKILVGMLFLRFVLLTKIIETYLSVVGEIAKSGYDISQLGLRDIGIGKSVLKYFDTLQDFDTKTVDDWLNYKVDAGTAKYFYSSMKRILSILVGNNDW